MLLHEEIDYCSKWMREIFYKMWLVLNSINIIRSSVAKVLSILDDVFMCDDVPCMQLVPNIHLSLCRSVTVCVYMRVQGCLCVCVYVHACMCVCLCDCVYAIVHESARVLASVCMQMYVGVRESFMLQVNDSWVTLQLSTCVSVCACVCVCDVYVCLWVYVCVLCI